MIFLTASFWGPFVSETFFYSMSKGKVKISIMKGGFRVSDQGHLQSDWQTARTSLTYYLNFVANARLHCNLDSSKKSQAIIQPLFRSNGWWKLFLSIGTITNDCSKIFIIPIQLWINSACRWIIHHLQWNILSFTYWLKNQWI